MITIQLDDDQLALLIKTACEPVVRLVMSERIKHECEEFANRAEIETVNRALESGGFIEAAIAGVAARECRNGFKADAFFQSILQDAMDGLKLEEMVARIASKVAQKVLAQVRPQLDPCAMEWAGFPPVQASWSA